MSSNVTGEALLEMIRDKLPERPAIARIEVEEFVDQLGDPALRVWVLLAEIDEHAVDFARLPVIRQLIGEAAPRLDPNRFAYVRFSLEHEFTPQGGAA